MTPCTCLLYLALLNRFIFICFHNKAGTRILNNKTGRIQYFTFQFGFGFSGRDTTIRMKHAPLLFTFLKVFTPSRLIIYRV